MVPIASTLAMPALWPVNLTLLVAIFPLLGRRDGKAVQPAGRPDAGTDVADRSPDGTGRPTLETA
jgi:hypothetical protein